MDSDIKIIEVRPYFIDTKCRVPLKFGAAVVERLTFCRTRVTVRNRAGLEADGWGGIFLMDSWCFPTAAIPHEKKDAAMKEMVTRFARLFESHDGYAHPVDIFLDAELEFDRVRGQTAADCGFVEDIPGLCALVCASSIDAAVHDAFGIVNGICTYDGYTNRHMQFDLARYLGSQFSGKYIGDYLRKRYKKTIPVFHLVGGLDKLRESELDENDVHDGFPNSLDAWIERGRLNCLKVKLRGKDLKWDIDRLLEVAAVAHETGDRLQIRRLYFSADTNEQCEHPDYIVEMLTKLRQISPRTFDELLYVEQPTERDLCAHRFDLRKAAAIKPVILDESLVDFSSFQMAMELGWSGIALKTCKCHTHALLFACLAEEHRLPYTVQDLTNPGIALIHSVGLAARLNPMMGVEANSVQFFPGASTAEADVHAGLFQRKNGKVSTKSILGNGLGYRIEELGYEA